MSCGGKLIDVIREIFANPGDTSQLLNRSAELCLKGSDVITCLIDSTNNDCGQTASTFLTEYMAVSVKPLTSFLSCPGELGAEASHPEPTPSAEPSYPEPTPSAEPSHPEPTPSAKPSYPEPTPSAKPSYPNPTSSAELSYPKQMKTTTSGLYPDPTPSPERCYLEITPSSKRATTTGVDYNKLTTPKMICKENEFKCRSNSCIPKAWICDGEKDCPGGEDEEECKSYKCLPGSWQCDDGICIKYRYKCNGIRDCKYGEDEKVCTWLTTTLRPKSSTPKRTTRQPATTLAPSTKKAPNVYVKPRVIKIEFPLLAMK